jgi:hypothetical protein
MWPCEYLETTVEEGLLSQGFELRRMRFTFLPSAEARERTKRPVARLPQDIRRVAEGERS